MNDFDGHGFRPPCFAQLLAFDGVLRHEEKDLPHPIAVFNHSWKLTCDAFLEMIEITKNTKFEQNGNIQSAYAEDICQKYKLLLYAAAEFIDNIENNIATSIGNTRKPANIAGSSSNRKEITIPCNKLKHNHNRITYCDGRNGNLRVIGFAICHIHKGVQRPNPEIHKDGKGTSLNVAIRRIFANLYLYAAGVGTKIEALSPNIKLTPSAPDSKSVSVAKKVSELPFFGLPNENDKIMPKITFDNNALFISRKGGDIFPLASPCLMTSIFTGDGHTRNFSLP